VSGPASPATSAIRSTRERANAAAIGRPGDARVSLWFVGSLIAGAWFVATLAQVTGNAQVLHHHALISSGGPPIWLAALLSLASWQVMIAAMMLPASLPAVRAAARGASERGIVVGAFLAAYAIAWTAFGLAAFLGDAGLHAFVHANPWLAERPQLIAAAVLALAGAYQFVPGKHRALAACRHPDDRVSIGSVDSGAARAGVRAGVTHAIDCVASSWALMLLIFAAGFANLLWMAILTVVMTYEALGRHGHRVAAVFGSALLGLAAAAALGLVPGF
jgi:predicted metal-binding membrane protein